MSKEIGHASDRVNSSGTYFGIQGRESIGKIEGRREEGGREEGRGGGREGREGGGKEERREFVFLYNSGGHLERQAP